MAMSFPNLALFLLVGLQILGSFVYASPPDPIWIGGVYDSADGDDRIATSIESALDGAPLAGVDAILAAVGFAALVTVQPAASPAHLASQVRAPPLF
jgi:hypothetical protein